MQTPTTVFNSGAPPLMFEPPPSSFPAYSIIDDGENGMLLSTHKANPQNYVFNYSGAPPLILEAPPSSSPSYSIIDDGENGMLFVPVGVRFNPSDQVIVDEYLIKRIRGERLPSKMIREMDVYSRNPDALPLDMVKGDENWGYFFVFRTFKYSKGMYCNRETPDGFWKATGAESKIELSLEEIVVFKRKLVFYWGKSPSGTKSHYIMDEYRSELLGSAVDPKMNNCVVCKVYTQKPRSAKATLARRGRMSDQNSGGKENDGGVGSIESARLRLGYAASSKRPKGTEFISDSQFCCQTYACRELNICRQ